MRQTSVYDTLSGRKRNLKTNQGQMIDDVLMSLGADFVPFAQHPEMPCDEIMLAILHFVSKLYKDCPRMTRKLDFSVLVGLAVMCEDELTQALGENGHLMYAQEKN